MPASIVGWQASPGTGKQRLLTPRRTNTPPSTASHDVHSTPPRGRRREVDAESVVVGSGFVLVCVVCSFMSMEGRLGGVAALHSRRGGGGGRGIGSAGTAGFGCLRHPCRPRSSAGKRPRGRGRSTSLRPAEPTPRPPPPPTSSVPLRPAAAAGHLDPEHSAKISNKGSCEVRRDRGLADVAPRSWPDLIPRPQRTSSTRAHLCR